MNPVHKKHKETEHVQNLHLIYSFAVLPETSYPRPIVIMGLIKLDGGWRPPPNHQPLQTHNPELPFIIHYSVLYNIQCSIDTLWGNVHDNVQTVN